MALVGPPTKKKFEASKDANKKSELPEVFQKLKPVTKKEFVKEFIKKSKSKSSKSSTKLIGPPAPTKKQTLVGSSKTFIEGKQISVIPKIKKKSMTIKQQVSNRKEIQPISQEQQIRLQRIIEPKKEVQDIQRQGTIFKIPTMPKPIKKEKVKSPSIVSRPTGKEEFTSGQFDVVPLKPFAFIQPTGNIFASPTSQPKFGTITKSFGGFTKEGKPIEVDTGFKTVGDIQSEKGLKKFKIQSKFKKESTALFKKETSKEIKQSQKEFQQLINKGELSKEEASSKFKKKQEEIISSFQKSPKFKKLSKEAEIDLSKIKDLPGIGVRQSKGKALQFLEKIPISSSAIGLSRSLKELGPEIQALTGAETIFGIGGGGQKRTKELTLAAGIESLSFAADVALTGGVGRSTAKGIAIRSEQKAAKELSLGLEGLGKSEVKAISLQDIKTGQFELLARQQAGDFRRDIKLLGKVKKGSEGLSFVPTSEGVAITRGILGKGIISKKPKGLFIGAETFDIGGIQVAKKASKPFVLGIEKTSFSNVVAVQVPKKVGSVFSLDVGKSFGAGVFSPGKSTFAILRKGDKNLASSFSKQFSKQTKTRGSIITEQLDFGTFGKKIKGKDISFSKSKQSEILGISGDFFKRPISINEMSFSRDPKKLTPFGKTFNSRTTTRGKPKIDTISASTKSKTFDIQKGSSLDTNFEILGKTLQKGLKEPKSQFKPFELMVKRSKASSRLSRSISKSAGVFGVQSLVTSQLTKPGLKQLQGLSQRSLIGRQSLQDQKQISKSTRIRQPILPITTILRPGVFGSAIPIGGFIPPIPSLSFKDNNGIDISTGQNRKGFGPSFTQVIIGQISKKKKSKRKK